MARLEQRCSNYVCPKSLILYAEKPAVQPRRAVSARPPLLRRLPRQHELRRTGHLPLVPRARAGAARPRGRRPRRTALPRPDALRARRRAPAQQQFWAQVVPRATRPDCCRAANPLRVLSPLNFYELVASRIGFLPEPFAFSVRAFRALAARLRGRRALRPRPRRAVPRLRAARRCARSDCRS